VSELRMPCWAWGDGPPGGWQREYLEWLGRYRRAGVYDEAPGWSCWLLGWPTWSSDERLSFVRRSLADMRSSVFEARRVHGLRCAQRSEVDRREWSRLALTRRLAVRLTLREVAR
jgi:hypothetical protein